MEVIGYPNHHLRIWRLMPRAKQFLQNDGHFKQLNFPAWCSSPTLLRPFARHLVEKMGHQDESFCSSISTAQIHSKMGPAILGWFLYRVVKGGGVPRGGGSLMFPKVPQSSLGILRVPQLPPPLNTPPLGTLQFLTVNHLLGLSLSVSPHCHAWDLPNSNCLRRFRTPKPWMANKKRQGNSRSMARVAEKSMASGATEKF